MNPKEQILRKTFPVVINSFNQPTYLKNLIFKFKKNMFKNIVIIDNASTSHELIKFYEHVKNEDSEVTVLFYNKNNGPRYFHYNNAYEILGGSPHLYTDPDIDFDLLPDDFLCTLLNISEKYKCFKVGCALEIPPPEKLKDGLSYTATHLQNKIFSISEWESQFWENPIENQIYSAPIDTTLHLFNAKYFHDPSKFISGIRVARDGFVIKHLPWYKNDIIPEQEKLFYKNLDTNFSNY
jgi:hypothetical protein